MLFQSQHFITARAQDCARPAAKCGSPSAEHELEMNISGFIHLDVLILIFATSRFHATVAIIFLEISNGLFLEEDCQPESLK